MQSQPAPQAGRLLLSVASASCWSSHSLPARQQRPSALRPQGGPARRALQAPQQAASPAATAAAAAAAAGSPTHPLVQVPDVPAQHLPHQCLKRLRAGVQRAAPLPAPAGCQRGQCSLWHVHSVEAQRVIVWVRLWGGVGWGGVSANAAAAGGWQDGPRASGRAQPLPPEERRQHSAGPLRNRSCT
jgi:hypothetical protein